MAGLFDPTDPTSGGLMGMYANPNTAGMLGMAQGLLAASGPSRLPVTMGQAMGQGMQGMQQGMGNAFQMQQSLMRMRAIQDALGQGGAPTAAPQKPLPYTAVTGSADTGGLMGVGAGMGSYGPQQAGVDSANAQQDQQFAQQQAQWQAQNSPLAQYQRKLNLFPLLNIPTSGIEAQMKYDPALQMSQPTDAQRMAAAAYGYGTPAYEAAIQSQVNKAGYVEPPSYRPGSIIRDPYTMQPIAFNPNMPAGTNPTFDASGNVVSANLIPGVTNAESAMAAAQEGGKGSQIPFTTGKDQYGNPLPVMSRTQAATGNVAGATTPVSAAIVQTESNGNPNAVSPKGAQGAWQVMPNTQTNPGFGVTPAQNNSPQELDRVGHDYYNAMTNRYGSPTIGAIAYNMGPGATDTWLKNGANWEQLPQETRNYVGKVSTLTALNSGAGAPQQAQPQQSNGKIYAEAPMGATTATNTAQNASSKQMQDSYNALANSDATYQQSRAALHDMMALAPQFGYLADATSKLPDKYHNYNSLVTQYDKAHATFVSNQYGALGAGTDASKGTVNDMVPGSDKPLSAQKAGLNTQLNNLDYRHLETQFMTPAFKNGDQKAYTALNAQFHNTITPEMMPLINTLTGFQTKPQLAAAIARVNQQYPQYKKAIDFLGANGMFDGVGQ